MKTLQELFDEVFTSEDLKQAFVQAAQDGTGIEAFAKAHGVEADLEEIKAFLKSRREAGSEELKPEELENVAGGCTKGTAVEAACSVAEVFFCGAAFVASVVGKIADSDTYSIGTEDVEDGGRLCGKKKK